MAYLKIIAFTITLLLSLNSLTAQNRWSAEFRPGLDFTTEAIGDTKLTTGYGFEAALSYKVVQHLNAYVGWGFNSFQFADNPEIDLDTSGYTFGFQFIHPISEGSNLSYLIRVGGIYNHIEIENNNNDTIQDTDHGLGYEFGGGLDYVLGNNGWSLRPQMGYRAFSRDLEILNTKTAIDLNYIVFALGISKTF